MPCPQPVLSATTQKASIRGFSAVDKQGNSTLLFFWLQQILVVAYGI